MPFQKGHGKFGGRTSGSKNKITRDINGLLDSLGCNPIEGMAKIATDENNPIEVRLRANAYIARYVHPELKAVELSTAPGRPLEINAGTPHERVISELARLASTRGAGTGNPKP